MMTAEAVLVGSAAELAVTVMLVFAETAEGALYVAALAVALVKLPHAAPVSPLAEALQVTPLLLESFWRVAVNFTVCP